MLPFFHFFFYFFAMIRFWNFTNLGHISTTWKCQRIILSYCHDLRRISSFSNLKRKDCLEKLESWNARPPYEWETPFGLSFRGCVSSGVCHHRGSGTVSQTRAEVPSPLCPTFSCFPLECGPGAVPAVHSRSMLLYSINTDESFSQADRTAWVNSSLSFKGQNKIYQMKSKKIDSCQALTFLPTTFSSWWNSTFFQLWISAFSCVFESKQFLFVLLAVWLHE